MKLIHLLLLFFSIIQASFAQINAQKIAKIDVSKHKNLTTVISHSMGDVNVYGYNGNNILAYSQELLPSLIELKRATSNEIYNQLTKADFEERAIRLKKVPEFFIEQKGDVVILKTNVYSFNSNIHVVTPFRSNIIVNIKDMGDILVKNIDESIEATTKSGDIMISDSKGTISANTQHGNVIAKFQKNRAYPLFASTFVGNIEIIVPKTTQNSILASSEMGSLHSNFSVQNGLSRNATNKHIKNRKINFDINNGGAELTLYTFKGDIYLRYLD